MKIILIAVMISYATSISDCCRAQNLVPNWSFEDTVSCPTNANQIDRATNWSSFRVSPDYFNSCANSSTLVSVPDNFSGFCYPKTGAAYSGFIVGDNAREFIGIHLSQSLNIGQVYYVSFYINRAGSLSFNRACNKIGAKLSTVSFSVTSPEPIDNISQVYTDSVIIDTTHWFRVRGSFVADSSYIFLSIGNFFNDSLTTYYNLDSTHLQSYYYLDDVTLSEDSNCCSNSMELYENPAVKIYPNPCEGWFEIELKEMSRIKIYDVIGRLVFEDKIVSFKKINMFNFDRGMYYLSIEMRTGNAIQKLILK